MIEQVDARLAEWAANVAGKVKVSLEPPRDDVSGSGVSLYLLDVSPTPPPRDPGRPLSQLVLRYLVTAWGEEPAAAHRLLAELAFAALETPGFELELEPPPLALWRALGARPQPAFLLKLPARRERPLKLAPLVRLPLQIDVAPLTALSGQVLGPGGIPIAGARVELPAAGKATRTGADGRFHFAAVPAAGDSRPLTITAKGRVLAVEAKGQPQPMVVHFQPIEEE